MTHFRHLHHTLGAHLKFFETFPGPLQNSETTWVHRMCTWRYPATRLAVKMDEEQEQNAEEIVTYCHSYVKCQMLPTSITSTTTTTVLWFYDPLSGTTQVSRYQNDKDDGVAWHQLNHMQAICTSLQKITMPAPHQTV